MSAYVIIDVDIHDSEGFAKYREAAMPVLASFEAEPLARTEDVESLEGDWTPPRFVIVRFNDMAHARAWHSSPEYTKAKAIRQRAARTMAFTVNGL